MPTTKARPGQTDEISVSIDRADLARLRKRAARLYQGNVSAVIAEGVRRALEEDGRDALVAWLGKAGQPTEAERTAIRAEWTAPLPPAPALRRRWRRRAA
jgi:hypothetical protein